MFEKIRVPNFLLKFSAAGLIVGAREKKDGSFVTSYFYIKGIHPGLMEKGSIRFLDHGWSGGQETEVMVCSIKPVCVFDVVQVMEAVA